MIHPIAPSRAAASLSRTLSSLLALVALLAIAVPVIVVTFPPRIPVRHVVRAPVRVVPKAELPPVEPVAFQALAPSDAREFNAAVPFSTGPNPAARPFRFAGSDEQRARATDCLAAAMIYEAGDDAVGERAVGQVIINRTRHPAFPKTICGVVFQGSERSTGCQFTFTCDGAMARVPGEAGWVRARKLAAAALSGSVFARVGHSTHYHTDWVVPYWSASLDKVAAVDTHLFFRWTGWWGTPPAFRRDVSSDEPVIPALATLSEAHRSGAVMAEAGAAIVEGQVATGATTIADPNSFLVTLDRRTAADLLPAVAQRTCGPRDYCKFMAWTDRTATPATLPPSPTQIATMAFSYLRDRLRNYDKPLWNCATYPRADRSQCMKVQPPAVRDPNRVFVPPVVPTKGPEPLTGVRRRVPQPMPSPTSSPVGFGTP